MATTSSSISVNAGRSGERRIGSVPLLADAARAVTVEVVVAVRIGLSQVLVDAPVLRIRLRSRVTDLRRRVFIWPARNDNGRQVQRGQPERLERMDQRTDE